MRLGLSEGMRVDILSNATWPDECNLGEFVLEFARQVRKAGAQVHMENAVPLCMFTAAEAGELILNRVLDPSQNARCEPIVGRPRSQRLVLLLPVEAVESAARRI